MKHSEFKRHTYLFSIVEHCVVEIVSGFTFTKWTNTATLLTVDSQPARNINFCELHPLFIDTIAMARSHLTRMTKSTYLYMYRWNWRVRCVGSFILCMERLYWRVRCGNSCMSCIDSLKWIFRSADSLMFAQGLYTKLLYIFSLENKCVEWWY